MSKIHFVERNIDSMYWAVSGSEDDNYEQGFKHVIKITLFIITNFTSIHHQISTPLITTILLLTQKQKEWHSIKNFLG
jgi:hypothetical protein